MQLHNESTIAQLLHTVYGGELKVSKKRKSGSGASNSPSYDSATTGYESPSSLQLQSQLHGKQPQGRPFSPEMVIDAIFPRSLDELYSFLCVKGITPPAYRVKLATGPSSSQVSPAYPHQPLPTFADSFQLIHHYTGATQFSIVTAYRQSSVDKSPYKKGTCPVVKFEIMRVTDYSIEFLKKMAYPRYKSGMKMYLIPEFGAQLGPEIKTFYTSPAMYLQDQMVRLRAGYPIDTESRIFHTLLYPDINVSSAAHTPPAIVYDRDREPPFKAGLNYILN